MHNYDHKDLEKKWLKKWEEDGIYRVEDKIEGKENEYILVEFPYPSGNLHVGHWYAFAVSDIYARLRRMSGKNVLFPIGFDAFGLPAENAAIKNNVNPREWTYSNMESMKKQLRSMGTMFDWSREIATCDPKYYKHTQSLFIDLYKNDLAYQAETPVNWCPSCKTVLANEQVISGLCERCDSEIEQLDMKQWMFRITKYADRLIDDLGNVNWPQPIKDAQINWIGKSSGAEIGFKVVSGDKELEEMKVFTTRPDTLYGATYAVMAPDHKMIDSFKDHISNIDDVLQYQKDANKKTELERMENKEKSGVRLEGVEAINPANGENIPIFISDYVLSSYGTGSIMAVPAHDSRDYDFAKLFNLDIIEVISGGNIGKEAYTGEGDLVNSGDFSGMNIDEAKEKITEKVGGKLTNTYRLRDWLISRQRYWGCPIPIIHCDDCGAVPVPKDQLPVELPEIDDFLPSSEGRSPLAKHPEWVNVPCPKCSKDGKRETDTIDTFIDSSWYYMRYTDSNNENEFSSKEAMKNWLPVDFYSGGAEHTTMHLLYSRFFTKALNDLGLIDFDEPFKERLNRGLILGPDGNKMSKSKGNVIDPDEIVERLGSDTVRLYLSFIGPYNEVGSYPWDPNGVVGVRRFLERVWRIKDNISDEESKDITKNLHKTIKKVGEDAKKLKFNTALSSMMTFINHVEKEDIKKETYQSLLKILAPFAPLFCEELWSILGGEKSIHLESWPEFDAKLVVDDTVRIGIQVNGKVRAEYDFNANATQESVEGAIKDIPEIAKWIEGKNIIKVVYVPGRIVNIVVKE